MKSQKWHFEALLVVCMSCGCEPASQDADAAHRDAAHHDSADNSDSGRSDASHFDVGDNGDAFSIDTTTTADAAHLADHFLDDAYSSANDAANSVDANAADASTSSAYDPEHRIGILYFVHHVAPAMAARMTSSDLTVEKVIRGQGAFAHIYGGDPYHGRALGHLYQHQPQIGFYCLFESIDDATLPADAVSHANSWSCQSDVSEVARTHALQLLDAGIDYVVLDLSNAASVATDISGAGPLLTALRPTQILFREWARLRQQGVSTPQIAAWAPVPVGATLWQRYLDLYNQYPDLALSHEGAGEHAGKKVFFYVDSNDARLPDASILAAIASNAGRDDVVAVPMWTHLNSNGSFGTSYRWAFMSPCMRQGQRTTSILGTNCDQLDTPQSVIGSELTIGPSYQYEGGYASLPFQSPGKLGGLTLKKQFQKAFIAKRNYLLITGWNETTSGHWLSAYNQQDVYAVGLEDDSDYGIKQFIDAYGTEYSRDIEPSIESGHALYDVMRACIARYKTGSCTVVNGQDCCDLAEPYVNVFSLAEKLHVGYAKRAMLSTIVSEVQTALAGHWRQVCNRYPGSADFCIDIDESLYRSGPFIAFNAAANARRGVYRCRFTNSDKTFLSLVPEVECASSDIDGGDTPLFYAAVNKSSETPRVLRRCYDSSAGSHFHAVGLPCPAGTEDAPAFGYVR